jgi:hypothetical protein
LFPDLWGLKPIAGVKATRLRLAREVEYPFDGPITPVDETPLYATMVGAVPANATGSEGRGWKIYPAGPYYVANSLRWLDYGGFDGGLSIFQKKWGSQDFPDIRTCRTEKDPNSLRLL